MCARFWKSINDKLKEFPSLCVEQSEGGDIISLVFRMILKGKGFVS